MALTRRLATLLGLTALIVGVMSGPAFAADSPDDAKNDKGYSQNDGEDGGGGEGDAIRDVIDDVIGGGDEDGGDEDGGGDSDGGNVGGDDQCTDADDNVITINCNNTDVIDDVNVDVSGDEGGSEV